MTRMAPKPEPKTLPKQPPAASQRGLSDSARGAPTTAVSRLAWRLGRSGSLVLELSRDDGWIDAHGSDAVRLCARVTLAEPAEASRASMGLAPVKPAESGGHAWAVAKAVQPKLFEGSALLSVRPDELHLEVVVPRGGHAVTGSVTVVLTQPDAAPVVLADLPARLGLRGGTYVLVDGCARSFADDLRGLGNLLARE